MFKKFIDGLFKNKKLDTDKTFKEMIASGNSKEYCDSMLMTLLKYEWVNSNKEHLLSLFPETETLRDNIDVDEFCEQLDKLGIPILTQDDFNSVIAALEFLKFFIENKDNPYLIQRNNNLILHKETFNF